MAISELQNFYKEQIAIATGTGAGNIYVTTKPVPVNGFLVISPGSESLREIIKYTGTGTDGNGDYVTVANIADRGLGGTTAQAHEEGEPVRMNYTAEHQKEIDDTIIAIVNSGAPNASTTVTGISKLSVAPVSASDPIAVGDNDPRMNATTGVTADQTAALAGGGDFGTPSGSNKFLTEDFLSNIVDIQEFTESGTWTKPDKGTWAVVEVVGAGGSGAALKRTPSGSERSIAGGGSGGAYRKFLVSLSVLSGTETVTIGAGGVARTSTASTYNSDGADGGVSWFKSTLFQANGGLGGTTNIDSPTASIPNTPGGARDEDFVSEAGGFGAGGTTDSPNTGESTIGSGPGGGLAYNIGGTLSTRAGGTSLLFSGAGGNGAAVSTSVGATAGSGTKGGGGGGVLIWNNGGTITSGAGGDGFVRVTVF